MASSGAASSSSSALKTSAAFAAALCAALVLSAPMLQPAAAAMEPECTKCVDGCFAIAKAACSGVGCTLPALNQTCLDRQYQLSASPCFNLCTLKLPF
ncbi:hypothetical protein ACP70R_005253 [Stipagrostis hirtigluma subsp. patula]